MKSNNLMKFVLSALLVLCTAGCKKDFLDRVPLDKVTLDNFYQSDGDLRQATGALYGSPWFDFNDKALNSFGDAMSGNLSYTNWVTYSSFGVSSGDARSNEAWRSLYKIVAFCNLNIIYINQNSGPGVTQGGKNNAIAELRFLRATAYFYLVQLWGAVPIITDNRTIADQPQLNRNIVKDVYRFIIEDLTFATRNLGSVKDPGRVNKWGAEGMLAKVYLTRAGLNDSGTGVGAGMGSGAFGSMSQPLLDSAKYYAGDVCKNSGLALVPVYSDLFLMANNNNDESLFAFQWYASPNYGLGNSFQGYFAAESKLTGAGDGYGSSNYPSYYIFSQYQTLDTRRKATFMVNGDYYAELLKASGGYTVTDANPHVKKYVVGTAADNAGKVYSLSTGINTYILRLADVYLTYAEATMGNSSTTNNPDALKYVNLVRNRAGFPTTQNLTVLNRAYINNPDYNATSNPNAPVKTYKDDLLNERELELAMEGQYWYDLLRLHNISSGSAIALISAQDRGRFSYTTAGGITARAYTYVTPTESAFLLQYPAADVTTDPKLLDPPVPFYKN
jgi:hypothetical protein